jgi:hypothetical protein
MTAQASAADVEAFAAELDGVAAAAAALAAELRQRGEGHRTEGAEEVGGIAASLAARVRAGTLSSRKGALPLSRPFGEWDYGEAAEPVWRRIDAVQALWNERLGGGDFEVVR